MSKQITTQSEAETKALAKELLLEMADHLAKKPVIFALSGEMGSGKTQFAQGIGEALQIKKPISSPTFVLMKEYQGVLQNKSVEYIHLDLWRVADLKPEELLLNERLKPGTILVIEWATPLLPYLKEQQVVGYFIQIESLGETERQFTIQTL